MCSQFSRLNVFLVQPGTSAEVVYDPTNLVRIRVTNLDLKPVAINEAKSRLRELDRLYEERLIKSEEYHARRHEIIKGL
jgi:predicted transcriptional regulator